MDQEFIAARNTTISNRKRSAVSFNLSSPDRDVDLSSFGERSTADSPHIRTLDDTFSAWHDSFRRADSKGSLYSYAGGSSFTRTPDIVFEDNSESSTSSSRENHQENDSRPSSRMSFLSDVSAANSVSLSNSGSVKSNESEVSIHCVGENSEKAELDLKISGENATEDESQNEDVSDELCAKAKNINVINENTEETEECGLDNVQEDLRESVDFNNTLDEKCEDENDTIDGEGDERLKEKKKIASEQDDLSEFLVNENTEATSENEELGSRISSAHSEVDKTQTVMKESLSQSSEAKEELVENEHIEKTKSQPPTSYTSEVSSEVSIPIIVSDGAHSETAEGLSIRDESSSNDTKEYENLKTAQVETTNWNPNGADIEVEEESKESERRNIGSVDSSTRNATPVQEGEDNENEDNTSEKLVDLSNVRDDGEIGSEDPNLDVETSSQYTLKGIQGILNARRRVSIAATSVGLDLDDMDGLEDDDWQEEEEKPYDLSTKEGMDELKEFLLGTNGEKLLRFWIDVECGKYVEDDSEMQM